MSALHGDRHVVGGHPASSSGANSWRVCLGENIGADLRRSVLSRYLAAQALNRCSRSSPCSTQNLVLRPRPLQIRRAVGMSATALDPASRPP
jgi:hypothetical protein